MIWLGIVLFGLVVYVFVWNTIRETKESEYNRAQACKEEMAVDAINSPTNVDSVPKSKDQSSKKKKK